MMGGKGHPSYYPGVWNKDVADGRERGQMEGKGHDNVHTHYVLKTSPLSLFLASGPLEKNYGFYTFLVRGYVVSFWSLP